MIKYFGLNRTFMELKLVGHFFLRFRFGVLIVPLWN